MENIPKDVILAVLKKTMWWQSAEFIADMVATEMQIDLFEAREQVAEILEKLYEEGKVSKKGDENVFYMAKPEISGN